MINIKLQGIGDNKDAIHTGMGETFGAASISLCETMLLIYGDIPSAVFEGLYVLSSSLDFGDTTADTETYEYRDFGTPEDQFDLTIEESK